MRHQASWAEQQLDSSLDLWEKAEKQSTGFFNCHLKEDVFRQPETQLVRHFNKPTFYVQVELHSTCPVQVENVNTAVGYFIHLTMEEDVLANNSAHEDIPSSSIILYIFTFP